MNPFLLKTARQWIADNASPKGLVRQGWLGKHPGSKVLTQAYNAGVTLARSQLQAKFTLAAFNSKRKKALSKLGEDLDICSPQSWQETLERTFLFGFSDAVVKVDPKAVPPPIKADFKHEVNFKVSSDLQDWLTEKELEKLGEIVLTQVKKAKRAARSPTLKFKPFIGKIIVVRKTRLFIQTNIYTLESFVEVA